MTAGHSPGLLKLIQQRRSVRRYVDRPVGEETIRTLLEAARWAPSAHNRQPWRFAVLLNERHRERLAHAMARRFRDDLLRDGVPPETVATQTKRSIERLTQAPALIVFFLSLADMDRYPDERRQRFEWVMAAQSVALAVQNMLLVAEEQGLGACWMCAPLFCQDTVREVLELPADWDALGLLTLGYPSETKQKSRDSLEAKMRWY